MKANELLRKYRIDKGMTLAIVAEKSNKPLSRISAIERGTIRLTVEEFIELCINGYNLNPSEVILETEGVNNKNN